MEGFTVFLFLYIKTYFILLLSAEEGSMLIPRKGPFNPRSGYCHVSYKVLYLLSPQFHLCASS